MTGEASAVLHYPHPQEPIPSTLEQVLSLTDLISPAAWARAAIDATFGVDPAEYVMRGFAGDWEQVSRTSTALGQLGEYFGQVGHEVEGVRAEVLSTWEGHAASGASQYFDTLAASIDDVRAPLVELAGHFETLSHGMYYNAQLVSNLINTLLDALFALGCSIIATASTSWTGVGLLVGAGATAYLSYAVYSSWARVVDSVEVAVMAAQGTVGTIQTLVGGLFTLMSDELILDGTGYDHPAV